MLPWFDFVHIAFWFPALVLPFGVPVHLMLVVLLAGQLTGLSSQLAWQRGLTYQTCWCGDFHHLWSFEWMRVGEWLHHMPNVLSHGRAGIAGASAVHDRSKGLKLRLFGVVSGRWCHLWLRSKSALLTAKAVICVFSIHIYIIQSVSVCV